MNVKGDVRWHQHLRVGHIHRYAIGTYSVTDCLFSYFFIILFYFLNFPPCMNEFLEILTLHVWVVWFS